MNVSTSFVCAVTRGGNGDVSVMGADQTWIRLETPASAPDRGPVLDPAAHLIDGRAQSAAFRRLFKCAAPTSVACHQLVASSLPPPANHGACWWSPSSRAPKTNVSVTGALAYELNRLSAFRYSRDGHQVLVYAT